MALARCPNGGTFTNYFLKCDRRSPATSCRLGVHNIDNIGKNADVGHKNPNCTVVFVSIPISGTSNSKCRALRGATMGDAAIPKFKCITHVLFDMDGLLLDTEKFYTIVQENILARYGKHFDWSLKAKMMGKKALDAAQVFVKESGLEEILTPEEFIRQREGMLHSLFPESELMPGVEQLIRHLYAHGVPMAVATSSHRRHYDLKTTKHKELFSLMHHVVVGDDPEVKQGKPSPDIFLVAARKFEDGILQPEKVLVLEDAPTGVAAAKNAGMSVVMVPDPNLDCSLCQGADQVLRSLLDFVPDHWGLPPYAEH